MLSGHFHRALCVRICAAIGELVPQSVAALWSYLVLIVASDLCRLATQVSYSTRVSKWDKYDFSAIKPGSPLYNRLGSVRCDE